MNSEMEINHQECIIISKAKLKDDFTFFYNNVLCCIHCDKCDRSPLKSRCPHLMEALE